MSMPRHRPDRPPARGGAGRPSSASGRVPSVVGGAHPGRRAGVARQPGRRDRGAGIAARPDLQYRIGSITKTMTAVLVLQLRDEGRLGLNDPVSTYLPERRTYGDRDPARRCCRTRSGIAAEPPGEWWERVEGGVVRRARRAALDALGGAFEPGATLPLQQRRLRAARRGRRAGRRGDRGGSACRRAAARAARDAAHQLRPVRARTPRAARSHRTRRLARPRSRPPTPARWRRPARCGARSLDLATYADFLIDRPPRRAARRARSRRWRPRSPGPAADGAGERLRARAAAARRRLGHARRAHRVDAGVPGRAVRRPAAAGRARWCWPTAPPGCAPTVVAGDLLDAARGVRADRRAAPWQPVDDGAGRGRRAARRLALGEHRRRLLSWDGDGARASSTRGPVRAARASSALRQDGGFVGVAGYHHGEPLEVVRRADGSVSHLVLLDVRAHPTPYDPAGTDPRRASPGSAVTGPG